MDNKWLYIAYSASWVATGFAVSIGIYFTKQPLCLWAMIIPLFISISSKRSDNNDENNDS